MIDLRKTYNLDSFATVWATWTKDFLTKKLEKNSRVRVKLGHKIKFFETRLAKYRYELARAFSEEKLDRTQRRKLYAIIGDYCKDIERNIKMGEDDMRLVVDKYFKEGSPDRLLDGEVNAIQKVFVQVYTDLSNEYAYKLFKKMNIRTCPYCNRQYTFTIKPDKKSDFVTRPEMDHFYDKSDYPLLALCFYNLVPSCHECNHGKGIKAASINPYFRGFKTKFAICSKDLEPDKLYETVTPMTASSIGSIKNKEDFRIGLTKPIDDVSDGEVAAEMENVKTFGLVKSYNEHRDYVMELISKATMYNDGVCVDLVESFQGLNHNAQDVYDFVWGSYLEEAEQINRPLSKLTKDILEQLQIKR